MEPLNNDDYEFLMAGVKVFAEKYRVSDETLDKMIELANDDPIYWFNNSLYSLVLLAEGITGVS